MVLQRKTQGWWLWARFHRLPHDIVIAVVSTLALRMAILLTLESNGGTIEIEPLWLSFIASLPLVFIFSHEAKPDLCAPQIAHPASAYSAGICRYYRCYCLDRLLSH